MIGRQQEGGIQGERVAQPQPRGEAVRGVQGVVSSCAGGPWGAYRRVGSGGVEQSMEWAFVSPS